MTAAPSDPDRSDAATHVAEAKACARRGDLAGAAAALRAAEAAGGPPAALAAFLAALGLSFHQAGRLAEAEAAYRDALRLDSSLAEPHNNLAGLCLAQGRAAEAEAHYRQALALEPRLTAALGNLVILLRRGARLDEAEAACRAAAAAAPGSAEVRLHLGRVLEEQGRTEEARAAYGEAHALSPSFAAAARQALALPVIPASAAEATEARARFEAGLTALEQAPSLPVDLEALGQVRWFNLAYQGGDDRPLAERLCRLFRARAPQLTFEAPHVATWTPPAGRRIRVGFLSDFFRDHSIGRFYRGFVERLDRARFEVTVIHGPGSVRDPVRDALDAAADRAVTLAGPLAAQQRRIADLALDALFHPDVGMSSATYWLAYARLAPAQFTSLGHPVTSGLDTMDWFVSSALTEPEGAEAHYSERLARLARLPCFYPRPAAPEAASRADFGLPDMGTLYGCPQSLFKLHPEFDAVLAEIAARDPRGWIVVPAAPEPRWTRLLKVRWERQAPGLLDRVVFLPRVAGGDFARLCAVFDVLLDPIHFGSGVTLYESLAAGTPTVTWPGRFARGRYVAGAYRQMGLADAPVIQRLEDYAALAVALGGDPDRRVALRTATVEALDGLYEDARAVVEFEAFIASAMAA
ncbi:O-linked N-acetylglucosamine transferase, SPINDLY family protein [Phenylobacterium sp.]|uniref:O-linked N-acetylglucosamine transferase, SPINDLY family protein n=1 Tax=Phenylobacterium sp. TaxID=1871053 RepID=UPI002FE3725A